MFLTLGLFIVSPDKVEVEPCFVVAALIGRAQAQDFVRNGESTVKPNFPMLIRFRRFKKPTNVSPAAWDRPGSPQWWRVGRQRQSAVGKGLFDGTDIVPVVAPPCCPVEVTGHQVHFFIKHHCTYRKDELLSNATFLSVNVADVQRQNYECFFCRWEVVDEKRHVKARPVKPSLNFLPSPCQAIRAWNREGRWI